MPSPKAAGGSASSLPGPAEVDILTYTYRMHMNKGSYTGVIYLKYSINYSKSTTATHGAH